MERADHTKEHMGLTTWADAPDGKIKKRDITTYPAYHAGLGKRLNSFIEMFDYGILQDAGMVTTEIARLHAETEFEKYRVIQDRLFMSDFDKYMLELEGKAKK